ncbi:unnamed protein product [Vitrella brassicaformis CCMP3155]|uniref:Uncharacterized protein n=4 Tax=Vitrella brassicaformis TaxID=1169539 RepID=A0A0G4F867_VITBC|nr:unnamed protein product [Vitrella brassicaformis CCMP3155]|eukprot:CEM08557.1 unnamed protein product [Vitrella brassicaformis CCMP3155]
MPLDAFRLTSRRLSGSAAPALEISPPSAHWIHGPDALEVESPLLNEELPTRSPPKRQKRRASRPADELTLLYETDGRGEWTSSQPSILRTARQLAASQLRQTPSQKNSLAWQQLTEHALAQLPSLSSTEIAVLVHHYARAGRRHDRLLSQVALQIPLEVIHWPAADIVMLVGALAKLEFDDAPLLYRLKEAARVQLEGHSYGGNACAVLAGAFVRLRWMTVDIWTPLQAELQANAAEMSARSLATVLTACGYLRERAAEGKRQHGVEADSATAAAVSQEAVSQAEDRAAELSPSLVQTLIVYLHERVNEYPSSLFPAVCNGLVRLRDAWRSQTHSHSQHQESAPPPRDPFTEDDYRLLWATLAGRLSSHVDGYKADKIALIANAMARAGLDPPPASFQPLVKEIALALVKQVKTLGPTYNVQSFSLTLLAIARLGLRDMRTYRFLAAYSSGLLLKPTQGKTDKDNNTGKEVKGGEGKAVDRRVVVLDNDTICDTSGGGGGSGGIVDEAATDVLQLHQLTTAFALVYPAEDEDDFLTFFFRVTDVLNKRLVAAARAGVHGHVSVELLCHLLKNLGEVHSRTAHGELMNRIEHVFMTAGRYLKDRVHHGHLPMAALSSLQLAWGRVGILHTDLMAETWTEVQQRAHEMKSSDIVATVLTAVSLKVGSAQDPITALTDDPSHQHSGPIQTKKLSRLLSTVHFVWSRIGTHIRDTCAGELKAGGNAVDRVRLSDEEVVRILTSYGSSLRLPPSELVTVALMRLRRRHEMDRHARSACWASRHEAALSQLSAAPHRLTPDKPHTAPPLSLRRLAETCLYACRIAQVMCKLDMHCKRGWHGSMQEIGGIFRDNLVSLTAGLSSRVPLGGRGQVGEMLQGVSVRMAEVAMLGHDGPLLSFVLTWHAQQLRHWARAASDSWFLTDAFADDTDTAHTPKWARSLPPYVILSPTDHHRLIKTATAAVLGCVHGDANTLVGSLSLPAVQVVYQAVSRVLRRAAGRQPREGEGDSDSDEGTAGSGGGVDRDHDARLQSTAFHAEVLKTLQAVGSSGGGRGRGVLARVETEVPVGCFFVDLMIDSSTHPRQQKWVGRSVDR